MLLFSRDIFFSHLIQTIFLFQITSKLCSIRDSSSDSRITIQVSKYQTMLNYNAQVKQNQSKQNQSKVSHITITYK